MVVVVLKFVEGEPWTSSEIEMRLGRGVRG